MFDWVLNTPLCSTVCTVIFKIFSIFLSVSGLNSNILIYTQDFKVFKFYYSSKIFISFLLVKSQWLSAFWRIDHGSFEELCVSESPALLLVNMTESGYLDICSIWKISITVPFLITPYLRVQNTRVGQLLPFQPSDEPCNQRGRCFVAGDTRVNENTALAAMHTIWVRLHNYYVDEIEKLARDRPGTFPTLRQSNPNRNIILFEETRKIVIAILQRIFYYEWLSIIVNTEAIIQI